MSSSLLTTAAARKAELLAELAKIERLAAAGETVAAVLDTVRVVQINNTTIAVSSKSGGGAFDTFVTDPALALEVRQFIAGRLEARALAEAGQPAPASPPSPTEPQPTPAPEIPAARSVAAEVSTPAPEPEAQPAPDAAPDTRVEAAADASIAHARAAGAAHRTDRNGTRVSPYKAGPMTDAWLSGWDAADAAAPKPTGPARGPVRPAPVARPAPGKPAGTPVNSDDLPF